MITPKDIENKTMSPEKRKSAKMIILLFTLEGHYLIS